MQHDVNRRRIGLILPSVNIRMEPEFNRCPQLHDFNFYTTRVMLDDTTEETLKAMEKDLIHAARMLSTICPEVVVYGCTSGSFISGTSGNQHIIRTVQSICQCPVVTTSEAMIQSMQELGVSKISMVTPYTDDINEKEKEFFQKNGIDVVAMKGLQFVRAEDIRTCPAEEIEQLVIATDTDQAQAVFISCTNVEGFQISQALEERLHKPVVSSNIATLWAMLRCIPHQVRIPDHGTLLRDHLQSSACLS